MYRRIGGINLNKLDRLRKRLNEEIENGKPSLALIALSQKLDKEIAKEMEKQLRKQNNATLKK